MASRSLRQQNLPFFERSFRRRRMFKITIVIATIMVIAVMYGAAPAGRFHVFLWASEARKKIAAGLFGLPPERAQIDAEWTLRRQRGIESTRKNLIDFYQNTTEEMRELFRVVGMDPEHGLIRYGRGDEAFVISSQVFEPDDSGRSYRFRPNTRSVWLRQITLRNGPLGLFQVLDTPEHRAAAGRAGAIVEQGSLQTTNSWGLRGPEPDLSAPVRGIVLGDSFMQAMFNGEPDTPAAYLERYLTTTLKVPVSILNTGHIGYSPEQYYFSLCEYGERMRPQFVVVSVCPNDFGYEPAVIEGNGDWFGEAQFWLEEIERWCSAHTACCLLVPIPTRTQVEGIRRDDIYPSPICKIVKRHSPLYCDPLNEFVDEHLKLVRIDVEHGLGRGRSALYNRNINDDHFSPRGAALWADIVGRRLTRILEIEPWKHVVQHAVASTLKPSSSKPRALP